MRRVSSQPGNCGVLGLSEIERIRELTGDRAALSTENKRLQELELRDKSKKRIQKWPNTIYTLKQQKEEQRYRNFESEELRLRKLDEEERLFREERD
jgi:hypothetical protein